MRWVNAGAAAIAVLGLCLWSMSEASTALVCFLVAMVGFATLVVVNVVALVERSSPRPPALLDGDCACPACVESGRGRREPCGICGTPQVHLQGVWVCVTCDHPAALTSEGSIAF